MLILGPSRSILIAIDGVEGFLRTSQYRDHNGRLLSAEHLAVPRLFQQLLAGKIGKSGQHTILIAADRDFVPAEVLPGEAILQISVGKLSTEEAAAIYAHLGTTGQLLEGQPSDAKMWENYVATDGHVQLFTRGLCAIPGTTSRGNVKKGRGRGAPQRADKTLSVTI